MFLISEFQAIHGRVYKHDNNLLYDLDWLISFWTG